MQTFSLRSEKLDEDINILSNDVNEKRVAVASLDDKLKRYSILKDVAEELSTVLSSDDINRLLIEKTLKTIGSKGRVLLFLVDMEKQDLTLAASRDFMKVKTKKGDVFDQWVFRHRKSLTIDDVTKDFRFSADDIAGAKKMFRSLIATPLISDDKVIGLLRMDNMREYSYTHDDMRLLDILADLGAVAIQNAMLYSRTQELAVKDGLTGLYVRRYFMDRFQEEIKRAARKRGSFSILMFDIDYFKDYNDMFGHAAGDMVLQYLSGTILSMVREVDIVSRYGGEEIILLLIGADAKTAAKKAESIRKAVESRPVILKENKSKITVSVGLANYPDDATIEEELIKTADERLYKAKAQGRNRVCIK